jgi:Bacterial membrane protein YfhO
VSRPQSQLVSVWGPLCLLVALTFSFFAPLFEGRTFSTVAGHQAVVFPWRAAPNEYQDYPQSDQADLNYPWQSFIARSLRSGQFPFWNPYSFGGQPFFANGSSGVLYPPRILTALVLPPSWAHDVLSIFHVLAAGLCMFLLLREFGSGIAGALLAAVSWMFSSFNLAWLHLEVVAPVFVFLPLALLCVRRAVVYRSWSMTGVSVCVLGVLLVSGHLPFMGLTFLVAALYALSLTVPVAVAHLRAADGRAAAGAVTRLLILAVAPIMLAAVVLLPTVFAIIGSQRHMLRYEDVHHAIRISPKVLFRLFWPPILPINEARMHQMAFVGSVTAVLAMFGAIQRRPGAALGRVLAVATLLIALDTPALRLTYALVPGFGVFRPLGRLLYFVNFSVALLAGLGLDMLLRWSRVLSAETAGQRPATRSRWRSLMEWQADTAMMAFSIFVIGFTAAQLITYGRLINPPFHPRRADLLYPETSLVTALRGATSTSACYGRHVPLRRSPDGIPWAPPTLFAAEAMVFGLESAGGYDSVIPKRSLQVWRVVRGEPVEHVLAQPDTGAFVPSFDVRDTRFDLLPRLGVTAIAGPPDLPVDPYWAPARLAPLTLEPLYAGPDGQLFRIRDSSCGPWVVHDHVVARDANDALSRFVSAEFDFRRTVILEEDGGPVLTDARGPAVRPSGVNVAVRRNNALIVMADSTRPGWLVVPDTWDAGWRATVNGEAAKVFRANYAFRAVRIPEGHSEVSLSYRPQGFWVGLITSSAGAVVVLWVTMGSLRRNVERRSARIATLALK